MVGPFDIDEDEGDTGDDKSCGQNTGPVFWTGELTSFAFDAERIYLLQLD